MTLSFYIDANYPAKEVERIVLDAISQDSRVIQDNKPNLSIAQVDSIGILLNAFVWSIAKDHAALKKDLLKITIAQLQKNHIKTPTISTNT